MLQIVHADPRLVEVVLNTVIDMPAVAFVGVEDDIFAGSGGLAWGNGRCWLWFTTVDPKPEYARPVLRAARQLLRKAAQLGESEVFTVRDPHYETSPRLLILTGFKFHAVEDGNEVHRCELRGD